MKRLFKIALICLFIINVFYIDAEAGDIYKELRKYGWNSRISRSVEKKIEEGKQIVAIFDHDGTVMYGDLSGGDHHNQPGVLKDIIKNKELKPEAWSIVPENYKFDPWEYFLVLKKLNIDSAYTWRSMLLAGYTKDELLKISRRKYDEIYKHYLFPEVKGMMKVLRKYNADIYILSAGPEILIKGASEHLGVPEEKIYGMRYKYDGEKLKSERDEPHSYGAGKVFYITEYIKPPKDANLFIFGNSHANDGAMLRYAKKQGGLGIIIDPSKVSTKKSKRDRFLIQRVKNRNRYKRMKW